MQPQRVLERHLIFKPRRTPGQRGAQVGGTQGVQNAQAQALQGQLGGELYYLQLVGEVEEGEFEPRKNASAEAAGDHDETMLDESESGPSEGTVKSNGDAVNGGEGGLYNFAKQTWSLRFNDLPEVTGRRPVTSRLISSIDIVEGDALDFMNALGYNYVSEYVLEGHRVIHNNIVLLLHRILRFTASPGHQGVPLKQLPPCATLKPLDPSGAYLLQASVRVQDGSKPEGMTLAINELKTFKDLMKGVVDLEVGDRLSLDTRVR